MTKPVKLPPLLKRFIEGRGIIVWLLIIVVLIGALFKM